MPFSPKKTKSRVTASDGASRVSESELVAPPSWVSSMCTRPLGPSIAATRVTRPSTGRISDSACGPMSQSAPRSRRQVESPYGFPGWKIDANMVARACCQPPAAAVEARNPVTFGWKRWVKKTTEATPDAWAASTTRSAPARSSANGLSSSRCRPAVAARTAMSACTSGGSATAIASHASISASTSVKAGTPCRVASSSALAGLRPHTPARRARGCASMAAACVCAAQ